MEKRILMTRLLMFPLRSLAYPVLAMSLLVAGCATPLPPNPYTSTPKPVAQRPVEPISVAKPVETAKSPTVTPVFQVPAAATPELPKSSVVQSAQIVTPAPPGDLWVRIRQGMAMRDLAGARVSKKENWYATRPDYLQRMTERSGRYLFHIVEEIERRSLRAPSTLRLSPAPGPQACGNSCPPRANRLI
jgi:membrane-bound lytic murein transglycosylase D